MDSHVREPHHPRCLQGCLRGRRSIAQRGIEGKAGRSAIALLRLHVNLFNVQAGAAAGRMGFSLVQSVEQAGNRLFGSRARDCLAHQVGDRDDTDVGRGFHACCRLDGVGDDQFLQLGGLDTLDSGA